MIEIPPHARPVKHDENGPVSYGPVSFGTLAGDLAEGGEYEVWPAGHLRRTVAWTAFEYLAAGAALGFVAAVLVGALG